MILDKISEEMVDRLIILSKFMILIGIMLLLIFSFVYIPKFAEFGVLLLSLGFITKFILGVLVDSDIAIIESPEFRKWMHSQKFKKSSGDLWIENKTGKKMEIGEILKIYFEHKRNLKC